MSKIKARKKYGRMTVQKLFPSKTGKVTRMMAECVCDCGKVKIIRADGLSHGTQSCGCLNEEVRKRNCIERNKKTAVYNSFSKRCPKTFQAWSSMRARCCYPSQKSYKRYGGAGIKICSYLKESPENLKSLIGKIPGKGYTLDRFPVHNGNYTCGRCEECMAEGWRKNVRWATRLEQSLNRGDFNIHVTAFGKTLTLSQWRDLTGIHDETLRKRLIRGWDSEKIVGTPDSFGHCYAPGSGTVNV